MIFCQIYNTTFIGDSHNYIDDSSSINICILCLVGSLSIPCATGTVTIPAVEAIFCRLHLSPNPFYLPALHICPISSQFATQEQTEASAAVDVATAKAAAGTMVSSTSSCVCVERVWTDSRLAFFMNHRHNFATATAANITPRPGSLPSFSNPTRR